MNNMTEVGNRDYVMLTTIIYSLHIYKNQLFLVFAHMNMKDLLYFCFCTQIMF